jgi:hypothetical protein
MNRLFFAGARWILVFMLLLDAHYVSSQALREQKISRGEQITLKRNQIPNLPYTVSKTPYRPKQDPATYEKPPNGFIPVFTQIVTRHGSRGLSDIEYDAVVYNMWKKAREDGALTPLGVTLGHDIEKLMKANALLGYGVEGIQKPGYGNLTKLGIAEQQSLAIRLYKRLPELFSNMMTYDHSSCARRIIVENSGESRVEDSAKIFIQSLVKLNPALSLLVFKPIAPTGESSTPLPNGTNRFLLYFHNLKEKTDLVTIPSHPYYQTYIDSLSYQDYKTNNVAIKSKLNNNLVSKESNRHAHEVLERIFSKDFLDRIENGSYSFSNDGTFTFLSDDRRHTATLIGDGKTAINTPAEAASALFNLYIIGPAFKDDLKINLKKYITDKQARYQSYLSDVQDFYEEGPGIKEHNPNTYKMAQVLLDDFFNEVDAIENGDFSHGATLRFTHGEEIVAFASLLGLPNVFVPLNESETYSYENNPWRSAIVFPMLANIQWDVFSDQDGTLLVKMLYNEKETDFKTDCDSARYNQVSHYYRYKELKACYGHGEKRSFD